MTSMQYFHDTVKQEIKTSRRQQRLFLMLWIAIGLTTAGLGATISILTAIGFEGTLTLSICAALITLLGTISSAVDYGRFYNSFRSAKTQFQGLKDELVCTDANSFNANEFSQKLQKTRYGKRDETMLEKSDVN